MATVKMKEGWLVLDNVSADGTQKWEWCEREPYYKSKYVWHEAQNKHVWVPNAYKRILYIDADDVKVSC